MYCRPERELKGLRRHIGYLYDCYYELNQSWPFCSGGWGPLYVQEVSSPSNDINEKKERKTSSNINNSSNRDDVNNRTFPQSPLVKSLPGYSFLSQTFYYAQNTDATLLYECYTKPGKQHEKEWAYRVNGQPHLLTQAQIALPQSFSQHDMVVARQHDDYLMWMNDVKRIVHPGEVNRLAVFDNASTLVPCLSAPPKTALNQEPVDVEEFIAKTLAAAQQTISQSPTQRASIVATHTDHPAVLIWNFDTQQSRFIKSNVRTSVPDLFLFGHADCQKPLNAVEKVSYFALDTSKQGWRCASGGVDQTVCMWDLNDYQTTLSQDKCLDSRFNCAVNSCVDDVAFHPRHEHIIASVGRNRCLVVMDARSEWRNAKMKHAQKQTLQPPHLQINTFHNDDVNALSWNPIDDHLILTGSSDCRVHLIDLRMARQLYDAGKLNSKTHIVHEFEGHTGEVKCVSWSPSGKKFASGADDANVNVWSTDHVLLPQYDAEAVAQPAETWLFPNDEQKSRLRRQKLVPKVAAVAAVNPNSSSAHYTNKIAAATSTPRTLTFRHAMHSTAIQHLQWNPVHAPGETIMSMSAWSDGGGQLHAWRMSQILLDDIATANERIRLAKRLRKCEEAELQAKPARQA